MSQDLNALLDKAKELLKDEMTQISHRTWIEPLQIDSVEGNKVVLIASDPFKKETVESRFHDLIMNTFNLILQKECEVSFVLKSDVNSSVENLKESSLNDFNGKGSTFASSGSFLNPTYTFDNFVVGEGNRFVHAASIAVAEAPATNYNPLFLYGGVGLGKTHLMHAIGNEIIKNNKNLNVLYVTSEKFTNEFINSLKDNNPESFRQKYRNIDVLLIDDIQFIAGKERLQEEFFHTFNSLHTTGKQIVLSSDSPPRDIPLLEDRLKSRFEWGLIADVSMADYETRLAILRKKTDEKSVIIDDDILSNIAAKIDSNIRELEGVFNKLIAQSSLTHTPITMEMSENAINDIIRQKDSVISVEYIQEVVCKYFDVTPKDLQSSQRSNDITFPRQVGMYLARALTNESFPKIGDMFGKRDHTTVMHACKKIEKDIRENPNTKLIVESVKKIILNKKQ